MSTDLDIIEKIKKIVEIRKKKGYNNRGCQMWQFVLEWLSW